VVSVPVFLKLKVVPHRSVATYVDVDSFQTLGTVDGAISPKIYNDDETYFADKLVSAFGIYT
jgi:hypothetical protein